MPSLLLTNIAGLVASEKKQLSALRGNQMRDLPLLENAYLLVENDRFARFGDMSGCPQRADEVIDATGCYVLPAWCDSHTHLVFAAWRETEFVDRINGLTYEEISQRGGGILNSARRMQQMPEEALFEQARLRLEEVISFGTGAIEIKSGYGLTVESELKMLRVIRRLKETYPLPIKATFLGAHAMPQEYQQNREGYLRLIREEMLPRIAAEGLADYIDVFCEKNFFSVAETEDILETGTRYGLKAKIHTNQFNAMGGIQAAIRHGAVSVDHLEVVNEEEIQALQKSNTIATLLPSAPFFLNDHYPPARRMIDAGLAVALATDFNPGTTPSGNLPFVLSLACIKMRMSPEETINAATINGAAALEIAESYGSISPGKTANFILTHPMPSLAYLPYAFGSRLTDRVYIHGRRH